MSEYTPDTLRALVRRWRDETLDNDTGFFLTAEEVDISDAHADAWLAQLAKKDEQLGLEAALTAEMDALRADNRGLRQRLEAAEKVAEYMRPVRGAFITNQCRVCHQNDGKHIEGCAWSRYAALVAGGET